MIGSTLPVVHSLIVYSLEHWLLLVAQSWRLRVALKQLADIAVYVQNTLVSLVIQFLFFVMSIAEIFLEAIIFQPFALDYLPLICTVYDASN